jgi:hypothetical protein
MRSTKSRLIDPTAITSAVPLSISAILGEKVRPSPIQNEYAGPDATNFPEQDFIAHMRDVQVREPEAIQFANQSAVNRVNIVSTMSLNMFPGEIRMPVRPAPISSATAEATSMAKRILLSIDPPYWSVLTFALSERNW